MFKGDILGREYAFKVINTYKLMDCDTELEEVTLWLFKEVLTQSELLNRNLL